MPAVQSSILIGSITIPLQSFTVGGLAASVPADDYYLEHSTSSLSLIRAFDTAAEAAVGGLACTVEILRNRRVRITFDSPQAVNWGTATQLRDLLGFTGNLGAGTSHVATNISPLLWSPGYPATPKTIPGVAGYTIPHQAIYKSDDGTQAKRYHFGTETWQDLEWTHIVPSRLRTTGTVAAQGGTFHQFFEQCAMLGARFFHYEDMTEDTADASTALVFGVGQGPYVLREGFDGDWYRRRVRGADVSSPLELPIHVVAEYD